MNDKEKELLQTLYRFYSEEGGPDLNDGDEILYSKTGSKHDGKEGIYKGIREDGQFKIKFDNYILYASPGNVKKLGKPKDLNRLFKILQQMVEDGDLSKTTMDKFMKEVSFKTKMKILDPYSEENWEEEVPLDILKPKKKIEPKIIYRDAPRGC